MAAGQWLLIGNSRWHWAETLQQQAQGACAAGIHQRRLPSPPLSWADCAPGPVSATYRPLSSFPRSEG